jgi:hypothetical protein
LDRRCRVLGFAITAIFAGSFRLPRSLFLVVYLVLAAPFLYAFTRWSNLSGELIRHNWVWGLIGAVLIGAFTGSQYPLAACFASFAGLIPGPGYRLAGDRLWCAGCAVPLGAAGAGYLAGLLGPRLDCYWPGKIAVGVIALIASLLVTVAYHLGYPEYRMQGGIHGALDWQRRDEHWLHFDQ